ncbi:leucine-rich repeat domain-containing protein [Bacteroides sp.]|uniref:leucine-rich repeat domain-containing protein n=1 Tax=Bacteroides sp. TaxID=29523 RepID=UPI00260DBFF8|nr:leucine-rich repeat domain-containing protein [Bacteroides sp.]
MEELRNRFKRLEFILNGEPFIRFKDFLFFRLCLPLWDTNGEGGIAKSDGNEVVPLLSDTTFAGTEIVSAIEFKYLNWKMATGKFHSLFKNCTKLKEIGLKEGSHLVNNMFENCTSLEIIELPNVVDDSDTSDYTFLRCESLKRISLPGNKKRYGNYCFSETALEKIEFPDAVTLIRMLACHKCNYLKEVVIGTGITEIGNAAFNTCPAMKTCYIKATTPPIITQFTFDNNTCNIYVPRASVDIYKSATNWSKYVSRIYGYDF